MTYMTKQQQAVLACIRGCADGIGAAELTELLHRQGETVGLTTVYRQLERLEKRERSTRSSRTPGRGISFAAATSPERTVFC